VRTAFALMEDFVEVRYYPLVLVNSIWGGVPRFVLHLNWGPVAYTCSLDNAMWWVRSRQSQGIEASVSQYENGAILAETRYTFSVIDRLGA